MSQIFEQRDIINILVFVRYCKFHLGVGDVIGGGEGVLVVRHNGQKCSNSLFRLIGSSIILGQWRYDT